MTVQLEYFNHFISNSYYAGIMLNAFSDLLCSELYWQNRLVLTHSHGFMHELLNLHMMHACLVSTVCIHTYICSCSMF